MDRFNTRVKVQNIRRFAQTTEGCVLSCHFIQYEDSALVTVPDQMVFSFFLFFMQHSEYDWLFLTHVQNRLVGA